MFIPRVDLRSQIMQFEILSPQCSGDKKRKVVVARNTLIIGKIFLLELMQTKYSHDNFSFEQNLWKQKQ